MKLLLSLTFHFILVNTLVYSQVPPDTNKAIVLFCRTTMWGGAFSYRLMKGDSVLTKIKYKSFYPIEVKEGAHTFWAKNAGGKDEITMSLKAGHTYIIKCKTSFSIPVPKPKMILLSDKEAMKELNDAYLKEKLYEYNIQSRGTP